MDKMEKLQAILLAHGGRQRDRQPCGGQRHIHISFPYTFAAENLKLPRYL